MTPDDYCQEKTAPSGSSLYYSLLYQAPEQRRAIIAVHAFGREIGALVDDCRDDDIALQTLQWWRMEITRAYAGNATHPVCQALQPAITAFELPQMQFLHIIEGHERDLWQAAYASFAELEIYCQHVAGALQQLTAKICGFQQPETPDYARKLGTAIQLSHILRTIHRDTRHGKIYLPQDEMSQQGVSQKDFIQARYGDNMQSLLAAHIARADDYFGQALNLLPAQDRAAQRYSLILCAIHRAMLKKLQKKMQTKLQEKLRKNNLHVLNEQISLSPLHKLWIAWRTR